MDFDHRDRTTKKFEIGQYVSWSMKSIMTEVEKCDVVCSNCHRERTHGKTTRG